MKTIKTTFALALVVLALAVPLQAQTQPTKTTLSAAMPAGATTIVVASATGFATSINGANTYVLIEKDLRRVTGVSGTTITLGGQTVGVPVAHASGADVIFGPAGNWNQNGTSTGVFLNSVPTGSCTRSAANQQYLPAFVITREAANAVDCVGGKWIAGTLLTAPVFQPLVAACTVPIGHTAYGSLGTDTAISATVEYTASIFVPYTFIATGITHLNGSAVDTNGKKIVILKDTTGIPIANSATAGTAASGNDAFQAIAFTATRIVVGPALYGVGIQGDTADAGGIRTIAASTFNNVVASGPTSVFGTVATLAFPTTFTANLGPFACLYR